MLSTTFKHLGREITINGYDEHVYNYIKNKKTFYEASLLRSISGLTKNRPGIFIDGGANIGNHTLFFAIFCNSTKVIAYEPYAKAYDLLDKNIRSNGLMDKVQLKKLCLHNKNGFLKEKFVDDKNLGATMFCESSVPTEYRAVTLNSELAGQNVTCIKLDIQDAEFDVLKASSKILKNQKPVIVSEAIHDSQAKKLGMKLGQFPKIDRYLKGFGYKLLMRNGKPNSHLIGPGRCGSATYIWYV